MQNRVYSFLIGVAATLLIAGMTASYFHHRKNKKSFAAQSPFLDSLEVIGHRFNDFKFKFMERKESKAPTVLVAVDDESLNEIGRWPWGRDTMADLMQKLMDYQVKSVGMDVIFSEPERGFPQNDAKLGDFVAKNSERMVLGTFSSDHRVLLPYQDYCVNEAFLLSGGDKLIKINPSFVVDDEGESFDDLKWSSLFSVLFKNIQARAEQAYLAEAGKTSVEQLSQFQSNALAALKRGKMFDYCGRWLTTQDELWPHNRAQLAPLYEKLLAGKENLKNLDLDAKLNAFKAAVGELPIPQFGEWQGNIPPVQDPSLYTGGFLVQPDLDGYIRRYPLFYRSGNKLGTSYIPSLALQSFLVATGYRADVKIEKIKGRKKITAFSVVDPSQDPEREIMKLPVDHLGRLMINYYGPQHTLPMISARELFSEKPTITVFTRDSENADGQLLLARREADKKEFFKGRAAIIGITAVALYDLRNTPVAANYPGPEIHQTVLANLFEQNFLHHWAGEELWIPLGLLIFGLLLSAVLCFTSATHSLLGLAGALTVAYFTDRYMFEKMNVITGSVFLLMEISAVYASVIVFKYLSEERKKLQLKKTFAKYVSPAVVDELLKDSANLELGGRKEVMSVFFSDVRGFTKFSETMDPQDLAAFLNEYLTPMTEIVFNNKGTLDKYMGDGLMAFFGAPVRQDDHAANACRCALQSLDALKTLQAECEKRGWPRIEIGIGINTGPMSVGNMGSKIVQSYTVMGDAVNLGSRLEGVTKQYGVRVVISESTYEMVKDRFVAREIDIVRVQGKNIPIKIYELLAEKATPEMETWLALYGDAYEKYKQRHFLYARNVFSQIETQFPFDSVAKMYIKRCDVYMAEPPVADWDGVYQMRAK